MTVPISPDSEIGEIRRSFNDAYRKRYGHSNDDDEIEIVCVRGSISFEWSKIPLKSVDIPLTKSSGLKTQVYIHGQYIDCEVWNRETLPKELIGPVIIVESTGTTFIAPGWKISHLPGGHLSVNRLREAN